MMRSAVTVNLVNEMRTGPFVFFGDLPGAAATAKRLGFDAIELFPDGPDAVDSKLLGRILSDNGLSLAAVGTGPGWVKHRLHLCLPESSARQKARDFIKRMIDFAGPFHAPAIIGSMQGRHEGSVDAAAARGFLLEALDELGAHAASYSVPVLYEALNRYETNLVTTQSAAAALLRELKCPAVKLLADLFHMNIEEVDIAAALRTNATHLGHVHFVDSNRQPAGSGHIDYAPIAAALRNINYAGFLSAEAFPIPDSETAAKQTIATFRKHFAKPL